MYHNVSRGASPTSTAPRVSKIDLENLEELQDEWSKKYDMLRNPPPPPQINSPRSLRACAIGNVNPQYTLQKLSLKQHLFRVLGNASMLSALPKQSTTEYKVLMQSALRSFQEATIGLGTSQEKLTAYIAFRNQEELRGSHLASLRELRRQLVAEEIFEERKRNHYSRRVSRETAASERRSSSANQRGSSIQSQNSNGHNVLWSSKVEETTRSRRTSVGSPLESIANISGQLMSPVSGIFSTSKSSNTPLPSNYRTASTEVPFTALALDTSGGGIGGNGPVDFTPSLSPSGQLPYVPRDVSTLNSSYFGNRSIQSAVSNPSGAALPFTSASNSTLSPVPRRPVLSQKQPSTQLCHPHVLPQQPSTTQHLHDTFSESTGDVDGEVPIGKPPQGTIELESVSNEDLSVVSLNSNQLAVLLNGVEVQQPAALQLAAGTQNGSAAAEENTTTLRPANLFHEGAAKTVAEKAKSKTQAHSDPSAVPSSKPSSVNEGAAIAGSSPPGSAADTHAATSASSVPSSLSLSLRGGSDYTNQLTSQKQLAPNMPLPSMKPLALSNGSVDVPISSVENSGENATAADPHKNGVLSSPKAASTSTAATDSFPPMITQAEQEDGFVYYCANPTLTVTKFYGGAHFPIARAVKL